ncbi:uncharacterized protein LOC115451457 [Manduca sexta]|uniref:uncharacterized protein LOC115451457 n=1 Tax=Manduca sexta TaxID=7130 RepID=UPI00118394AB|nr:uncharacterized protein LOC115451457 [Manduca sexta]
MANSPLGDIEELTLCSSCRRMFDDGDHAPKLLACKHHFCLACARTVLDAGRDVYCAHCWKRTELPDGRAESLPTHGPVLALTRRLALPPPDGIVAMPLSPEDGTCAAHALPALWCCVCSVRACRACPAHSSHSHALRPTHEARALLARETRDLRTDLQRLAVRQRDLLLRALDAATVLKLRLEGELAAAPTDSATGSGSSSLAACAAERDRVRARHAEALAMARLDDLVRYATVPLDFEMMRRALGGASTGLLSVAAGVERRDPVLLLGNYCAAQMFARQWARRRGPEPAGGEAEARSAAVPAGEAAAEAAGEPAPASGAASVASMTSPPVRAPGGFPLFFFELEMNGAPFGRIVIEVRDDVAPRMARNFTVLSTGELGVGYRGCSVFQCWENESVITGDFELNNGRGGRSVFEESFFMPDDTRMVAVRGSVGMRRSQKRHDNLGLVGSQFRIVLREMRGFTAIFAFVVEGLELVDRLSRTGDSAGKPHSTILISDCGKLN